MPRLGIIITHAHVIYKPQVPSHNPDHKSPTSIFPDPDADDPIGGKQLLTQMQTVAVPPIGVPSVTSEPMSTSILAMVTSAPMTMFWNLSRPWC